MAGNLNAFWSQARYYILQSVPMNSILGSGASGAESVATMKLHFGLRSSALRLVY